MVRFSVSLLVAVAACAQPSPSDSDAGFPEPKSRSETYDQTCGTDPDCVIVAYRSCAPCGSCGDLAINVAEHARFDDDNELDCPPREPGIACGACPELRVSCADNACVVLNCSNDPQACP